MLARRIIVAIIGIPVLLGFLYLGDLVFSLLICGVTLLSLTEFYRLFNVKKIKANRPIGLFFGATMPLAALYYGLRGMLLWLTLAMVLSLIGSVFVSGEKSSSLAITLLGVIYIGVFLGYLILINKLPGGKLLVMMTFIGTWVADTSAYGVGSIIGKHRFAEKISPNKTAEGLVGAILINVILFLFLKWMPGFTIWHRALFAIIVTMAATAGDLVESTFKREVGVKDSGNLIPGHGGFLDRFDSLIFTSVAAYYMIKLMSNI